MSDQNPPQPADSPQTPRGLPAREEKPEDESVVSDLSADLAEPSRPATPQASEAGSSTERQRTIRQRRSRSRSHWNLDNQEEQQRSAPRKNFGWIFGVAALICTSIGGILVFALAGLSFFVPNAGIPRTLQIALVHLEQGDLNAAREFISATPPEARNSAYFYSLVTRMAVAHQDAASARQYLDEGLAIAPEDPLMLLAKAEFELASGTPDQAQKTIEQALAIDDAMNIGWRVLGQAKIANGDAEGGHQALKRSQEIAPNSVATITALVRFHMSKDDTEEASRIFRTSLEEHPNPDLSITYAGFLVQQGEDDAAAAAIDAALVKAPTHARLYSFQAKIHMRAENYTGAQNSLRSATTSEPKNPLHWLDLGNAYAADERYLDAGSAFKKAAELDPTNPVPVYAVGYTLLLQKDYAAAEAHLTDVFAFDPNHLQAHVALARLYEETFNEEKAKEHSEKAKELEAAAAAQQTPPPAQ